MQVMKSDVLITNAVGVDAITQVQVALRQQTIKMQILMMLYIRLLSLKNWSINQRGDLFSPLMQS